MKTFICTLSLLFVFVGFQKDEVITNVYFENAEIKIETILQRCDNPSQGTDVTYFLIKVTNHTNKAVSVSFEKQVWIDNIKQNVTNGENKISINLAPNEVKIGTCDNSDNKGMRIFQSMPSHLSKRILTQYELTNIQTNSVK